MLAVAGRPLRVAARPWAGGSLGRVRRRDRALCALLTSTLVALGADRRDQPRQSAAPVGDQSVRHRSGPTGSASTIVTSAPKERRTLANSEPITPPPSTT